LVWREGVDPLCDGVPEVVDGAGGGLGEEGLELGEGHLDGVEVGAVGRQEAQLGAGGLDGAAHRDGLVGRQVVHNHDVARGQGRRQDLFDIGHEGGAVHGAVEHHGRGHAIQAQRTHEGRGLPVPVGHRRPAPLAAPRAPVAPRHLGRGAGLVDEDQALGVQLGLRLEPGPAASQHVRALLLAGVRGFF